MRIISGYLKGRKILDPVDKSTRPLKDMVRESIFNILDHSKKINAKIKYSKVLDLYSGVGSFGLECLSRGAKQVHFCENYTPALNILKKNIKIVECENKSIIIENDITKLNKFYTIFNCQFNLVFLDPPFIDKNINSIIDKIISTKILAQDACIVIHRSKDTKEKITSYLEELKVEFYGKSKIIFSKISNLT